MATNIEGQGGSGIGARANDLFDRIGEELQAGVKALGLDGIASKLDTLLAQPSPLDRFAAPADAAPKAQAKADTAVAAKAEVSYQVKPGDTLSKIAARNGSDVATLARINGLRDPDRLGVGQTLKLSAGASVAAEARVAAQGGQAAPSTGGLSEQGKDFLYDHEAQAGVSNRLHWPKGASGVTLGPGYDMKGKSEAQVTRDLTAIGVDADTAAKVAKGAGLSGSEARAFAADNRGLVSLNKTQERQLLTNTVQGYADHVRSKITAPVTQNQFDAMVSFAYNIGTKGFDGSSALAKLNAGDSAGAAEAMKLWNKSDGKVNQGLVNRRNDEVALFNTPGSGEATPAAAAVAAPARSDGVQAKSAVELAGVIESRGDARAKADLAAGQKVVVALRTPSDAHDNGGKGVYDDSIAVVWKDAGGTAHARIFAGNTDPSAQYSTEGPKAAKGSSVDADGDGRNDLGRLQAGTTRYSQQAGQFLGNTFFRATATTVAERDTNHDGVFDARDTARIDRTGAGTSMLIHQGGGNNTWSAGCQTMAKSDFNAFVGALGGQKTFSYVLVDAK
jgi:LysM repeat protein